MKYVDVARPVLTGPALTKNRAMFAMLAELVNFAEVVFISALNKTGFSEMMKATKKAYLSSQKKLTTPQINSVLENALITHPPKIIKGIRPKLKYAHQGGLNPPQIIIHGNHLNEIKKGIR